MGTTLTAMRSRPQPDSWPYPAASDCLEAGDRDGWYEVETVNSRGVFRAGRGPGHKPH